MDFPVLHSNFYASRSGLIYDLMEPVRPSVDRRLYQFTAKTTLRVSDFFETRQGVCKAMPELTSKIIPQVGSLDPDIDRVVKEFAGFFKTRHVQAPPGDDWISGKGDAKKTKMKTKFSLFPLPEEFEETESVVMQKGN